MTREQVVSYEPTDTKELQLKSLDAFAKALGYERMHWGGSGHGYYSRLRENKHISNISLRTMCRLHNHGLLAWRWSDEENTYNFDKYKCVTANAAKIVQAVKLQLDKRLKRIICQHNSVKFMQPEYESIFLGE